jgi:hypothetical protein
VGSGPEFNFSESYPGATLFCFSAGKSERQQVREQREKMIVAHHLQMQVRLYGCAGISHFSDWLTNPHGLAILHYRGAFLQMTQQHKKFTGAD